MSLDYLREKFWLAADALATSSATIQKRLLSATSCLISLRSEDFPGTFRAEFDDLWHNLTRKNPVGSEGSIEATISSLSDEEAEKLAKRIFSLFTTIRGGI